MSGQEIPNHGNGLCRLALQEHMRRIDLVQLELRTPLSNGLRIPVAQQSVPSSLQIEHRHGDRRATIADIRRQDFLQAERERLRAYLCDRGV